MKKVLILMMMAAATTAVSAENVTIVPSQEETAPAVLAETNAEANEIEDVAHVHDAYRCTGDRVICRKGPGKNFGQAYNPYTRKAMYCNKGDILLPARGGVKNGYRQVYIPNVEGPEFWISVQYLESYKWEDDIY